MTFHDFFKLDFLTDRVAMGAAIIVSLGITVLGFVAITPDILAFRIVMGSMGGILVLFSPRALAKKKFSLWIWIAALIVFFEVSTVLTMTATQSTESITHRVDPIQIQLHQATVDAQRNLTDIIAQQKEANNRTTLDALAKQFDLLTSIYNQAAERESRYVSKGSTERVGIDPNKLFMAIPTAIMSLSLARWMTLVFSLIVAIVFQAVIKATVTATIKSIKREASETATPRRRKRRAHKAVNEDKTEVKSEDFEPEREPSMMEVL